MIPISTGEIEEVGGEEGKKRREKERKTAFP